MGLFTHKSKPAAIIACRSRPLANPVKRDNRSLAVQLANLADQIESVAVRHRDIAYHNVGKLLAEGRQSFSRRAGGSHPCRRGFVRHHQRSQQVRAVLNQEHVQFLQVRRCARRAMRFVDFDRMQELGRKRQPYA